MQRISDRLAAAMRARGLHYGWAVVATTFLVMLATAGAMGSAGILIDPLQAEFGWTNAQISTALSLRLVPLGSSVRSLRPSWAISACGAWCPWPLS